MRWRAAFGARESGELRQEQASFKARRLTGDSAVRKIFYLLYIEASIYKSVRRVPVFERNWFELRITVDPVIILASAPVIVHVDIPTLQEKTRYQAERVSTLFPS